VIALALTVVACSSSNAANNSLPASNAARRRTASPIQHVVFIVQENRSFNNLFMGFPGATTQNYGYDQQGDKISLQPSDLASAWDIAHNSQSFEEDCDGTGSLPGTNCRNDGWNNEEAGLGHPANFAYAYVPKKEIQPYWKIAGQYVLADNAFASNLDGSFVAHQYAISAYSDRAVDCCLDSWGCEGGKTDTTATLTNERVYGSYIRVCFDIPSLGINADKKNVTWRFYAGTIYGDGGLWSAYQANKTVYYGSDWSTDVVNPPAQFLSDIAAGTLSNVTWITPTYVTSDHAGLNASKGPAWVASVVNAIGKSKFWSSTAIFILWDDWGGWYDPVPPPYADYDGYGFRIPLIVVSPYAKQGSVTHTLYETASVLRYIEDNFGLPQMAKADARANDPADDSAVFDYAQQPRAFKKFKGAKPTSYWLKLEGGSANARRPAGMIGDD
jgi:phospholipase C